MSRHATGVIGRRHRGLLALALLLGVAQACLLGLRGASKEVVRNTDNRSVQESLLESDSGLRDASPLVAEHNESKGLSYEEGEVEQVATRLLCTDRDRGDCVLASSGYLDLFGSVWGCVVEGDGWADVCLVVQADEGRVCQVSVTHLDARELVQLF